MNATVKARLARIVGLQTEFRYNVRPPASPEAIGALAAAIEGEFGVVLPSTLREFYSRHDGLSWDDYKLWRVTPGVGEGWPEDVLSESLGRREDLGRSYVVLGQSSISLYGFNCQIQRWTVSDYSGADVFESFDDFDAYFERVLELFINDPSPDDAEVMAQVEAEMYGRRP